MGACGEISYTKDYMCLGSTVYDSSRDKGFKEQLVRKTLCEVPRRLRAPEEASGMASSTYVVFETAVCSIVPILCKAASSVSEHPKTSHDILKHPKNPKRGRRGLSSEAARKSLFLDVASCRRRSRS